MTQAQKKARSERAKKLLVALKKAYPKAKLALDYTTDWELMVAVQMSAQSTDKKVNEITKTLFKKYKTLNAYCKADPKVFENDISSVLYYRNKARNILASANQVKTEFKGELPRTMEEMLTLKGVARKTANVLLGSLYKIKAGIVVDTHMIRFALRYNLTDHKDAVRIEKDLMEVVPKKDWIIWGRVVVAYGREYGNPQKRALHIDDPLSKDIPTSKKLLAEVLDYTTHNDLYSIQGVSV